MANAVAPEHLSSWCPGARRRRCSTACRTRERSSSATGRRPAWVTTSPVPTTSCRPTARRASRPALRADDFRKHIHAVQVTPDGAARPRSARGDAGRGRGPAGARRLGPPAPPRARRRSGRDERRPAGPARSAPVGGLPLTPGRGRGAAQHERVAASPPPEAWREELLAALEDVSFHRYPDRPAAELRRGRRRPARGRRSGGLLRQRVQRGPAVPPAGLRRSRPQRPRCSSPPTRCTRTSPASPAPRWSRDARDDDFQIDRDDAVGAARRSAARHHVPVLAEQPDRPGRAAGDGRRRRRRRARPRDRRRGVRAVLAVVGAGAARSGPARAGRHPDLLQDVGDGRRTPGLPGGRPGGRRRVRGGRPALPPLGPDAAGRAAGPAPRRPRWRPAWPASPRSGAGWPPRWPTCRWTRWPSDANFILFRPRERDADDVWRALLARSVSDPQLRQLGRPARLPACHHRDGRGERPLPARPEGEPVTHPARAASKDRATKETTVAVALDVDGTGRTEVTTGLPFFDHMVEQLGRHASFDLSVQATGRPARRRPPHRRGRRHRPRGLPGRGPGRQGGRAPVRLHAAAPRRGARRGGARPVGTPVPRLRARLRPGHARARARRRSTPSWRRSSGVPSPRRPTSRSTSACSRARTRTTSSRPASRAWRAACATPCASREVASPRRRGAL